MTNDDKENDKKNRNTDGEDTTSEEPEEQLDRSYDVEKLVDAIREAPDLSPEEKEHTSRSSKADDGHHVFTEKGGEMRRFLRLKYRGVFEPRKIRVNTDDETGPFVAPWEYDGGDITAVKGIHHPDALKYQNKPRDSGSPADVVSNAVDTPDDTVVYPDDTFGDVPAGDEHGESRDTSVLADEEKSSTTDDEKSEVDTGEDHNDSDSTDGETESTERDRRNDDDNDWMAGQISSGPPDDGDEGGTATSTEGSDEDDPEEEQNEDNGDPEFRSALDW